MPLTPDQLRAFADQLWAPFQTVEQRVAAGLARAGELTIGQMGDLKKRALADLQGLRSYSTKWVGRVVPGLYRDGALRVDQGLPPQVLRQLAARGNQRRVAAAHRAAMEALTDQANARIEDILGGAEATLARIARAHKTAAARGALKGATVPLGSAQDLVDAAARGRVIVWRSAVDQQQYGLSASASLAGREEVRGALDDGFQNRCKQFGIDLVKVSSHGNPCPLCGPWEGVILSLDGETPGYPTLAEAIAAGYRHPNCLHVEDPVHEAEDRTDEDRVRVLSEVSDRRTAAEEKRNEYEAKAQDERDTYRDEALAAQGTLPRVVE